MQKNRSIKPLPLDEYKFTVPDIKKFKLKNGLEVLLVERHTLPIIRINLMSDSGSKLDPSRQKGLANLFAMTLDEGAGDFNALRISSEFDLLGSDFDIHCTNDSTYLLSRSLKEHLERTLELFSLIVKSPHLNDDEFKKEKRKVLTRMLQMHDDPDEIASNIFEYLIFGGRHPYAFPVIGREKDVENITIENVREYYRNHFSPEFSHIIIVGDIQRETAELLLNRYFSDWNNKSYNGKSNSEELSSGTGVYLINKPGSVQTEIRIGHLTSKRTPSNYFQRLMLNMILGGQFSSRINLNLRERKGYTYGAFSSFSFLKEAGYFCVSTSVSKENTQKALKEINQELVNIREGVTEEELLFAKTSMMRKFPSNFETNGQIASSLSRLVLYDLPDNHFKNYLETIHNISMDEVNAAGRDYILPDKVLTLLVGDKNEILKQLDNDIMVNELDANGLPVQL